MVELCKKLDIDPDVSCKPHKEPFLKCITIGLAMNVAKKNIDNVIDHHQIYKKKQQPKHLRESIAPYTTIRGGQPVHIHPSSVLFNVQGVHGRELPECVVYAELLITSKHYMRTVTKIESSWLTELLPHFFKKG